jgi:hypothetical protein
MEEVREKMPDGAGRNPDRPEKRKVSRLRVLLLVFCDIQGQEGRIQPPGSRPGDENAHIG